jgi:hypothetical protein
MIVKLPASLCGGVMAPDISAAHAPACDVAAAIMDIDSLLRRIHVAGGTASTGLAAEQLIDTPQQARDVLDGYCTVTYRQARINRGDLRVGVTTVVSPTAGQCAAICAQPIMAGSSAGTY